MNPGHAFYFVLNKYLFVIAGWTRNHYQELLQCRTCTALGLIQLHAMRGTKIDHVSHILTAY